MRSPVIALLWENWRLTRVEAAQRFVQGIVVVSAVLSGAAAFGLGNDAARFALYLLALTYMPLWLSVAKLNGGRFADGYRPGYPFYFLYTRPVRTFVLVCAPLAYNVLSPTVLYILSALALRTIFGYPFPVLPLAALLAGFHIAQWAAQWGTSNKIVQLIGSAVPGIVFSVLTMWRSREWPQRFDLSIGDYALVASITVASLALAVTGVARQRRGDARAATARSAGSAAFSNWLAGLFRVPYSTTSASLAQMSLDLRSGGLSVLAIGMTLAMLIPLAVLLATNLDLLLSGFYDRPATRVYAVAVAMLCVVVASLLGGNAFGMRTRQGHTCASVFEMTQAYGTARLAGLKVLVRSVCHLAALAAVGASIWISASVIPFDVLEDDDTFIDKSRNPVSGSMRAIEAAVRAMGASELLALVFVVCIAVAVMVALRASHTALRAGYPRRQKIAVSLLLFHGVVLIFVTETARRGFGSTALADALNGTTPWVIATAIVLATLYLLWRVLAERLLTLRSASLAVLVSVVFAAAWVTVLDAVGVSIAAKPATDMVWMLLPALLPLTASVLAPWSLSRVRHT